MPEPSPSSGRDDPQAANRSRPVEGESVPKILLSVITVAWNGCEMIRTHLSKLDSCREPLGNQLEVILVDNSSTDGTPDLVEREFPWVTLVRNDVNRGFAMGCRQGLERARGDYLLLLNPDCEAVPHPLVAMMDFLKRFPKVGAVGCRLVHDDGTPQRSAYRDQTPWRYILYHSALSPLLYAIRKGTRRLLRFLRVPAERWEARRPPRPCDWLMGACIMVPRRVFEQVGSLDPSYFMYSEDADWCRRIRSAGYDIYHLRGPALVHRQKQSSARRREFTYVRLYRSLLMLCLRRMQPDEVTAMRRVVLSDMALRRWIFPVLAVVRPGRAAVHREQLRATRRVAEIWRRLDPEFDPDPPPTLPAK